MEMREIVGAEKDRRLGSLNILLIICVCSRSHVEISRRALSFGALQTSQRREIFSYFKCASTRTI
jgi:hypothetical protein